MVAIVTGGARGAGRAIAVRLAAAGSIAVIVDLNESAGNEAVRTIEEAGGRAAYIAADVTSDASVEAMTSSVVRSVGAPAVLVNNAGGTSQPHYPEAPVQHWRDTIELNLIASMRTIQAVLGSMRARGGGAVVNIASAAGIGTASHSSPEYAAAKAGLIRLTSTLAPLATSANVRVNCIVPSWIRTDDVRAQIEAMTPGERPTTVTEPHELADGVLELVRDEQLAGRVLIWWSATQRRLLPVAPDWTA